MKQGYVTIPTARELTARPYFVSDFALANGAGFCAEYAINGKKLKAGNIMVRSMHRDNLATREAAGTNYFGAAPDTDSLEFVGYRQKYDCNAGAHDLGVMPRFLNASALGIATTKAADGREYVTLHGEVMTYCKAHVSATMERQLDRLLAQNALVAVDSNISDGTPSGAYYQAPVRQENKVYTYGGKFYTRIDHARRKLGARFNDGTPVEQGAAYWFEREPVLGRQEPNDCVQCEEVLFPWQFELPTKFHQTVRHVHTDAKGYAELDVNEFSMGDFLNQVWLPEMCRSVGLGKKQQPQPVNQQVERER